MFYFLCFATLQNVETFIFHPSAKLHKGEKDSFCPLLVFLRGENKLYGGVFVKKSPKTTYLRVLQLYHALKRILFTLLHPCIAINGVHFILLKLCKEQKKIYFSLLQPKKSRKCFHSTFCNFAMTRIIPVQLFNILFIR